MLDWDYEQHPNAASVLENANKVQSAIEQCAEENRALLKETRPYHDRIFSETVYEGFEAFSGCYRGANYYYLREYPVSVGGYNFQGEYVTIHTGTAPHLVEREMKEFHDLLVMAVKKIDELYNSDRSKIGIKLVLLARLLSKVVVDFLSIHPYANGNGHISRLLAWGVFLYFGFRGNNWQVAERPLQPFDSAISEYQKGNPQPMQAFFMQQLLA